MEFRKKRRVAGTSEYPTRLQLYKTPPVQTIPLKEFEELAKKRLECESAGINTFPGKISQVCLYIHSAPEAGSGTSAM